MGYKRWLFVTLCLVLSCSFAQAVVLNPDGSPVATDPNLKLWLDASDLSTLWQDTAGTVAVTTMGQQVARWDDKSLTGIIVSQGSAGNRPTYSGSVAKLNSLPALHFDGGSGGDALTSTTGNSTGITGNADRTVITVWADSRDTFQNYQHTFHMGNTSGNQAYGHSARRANSGVIGNHYWAAGFNTSAVDAGGPMVAVSMWDGDGGGGGNGLDSWYVNNVPVGASNRAPLNTGAGQLQIGSRLSPFTEGIRGDIAEVIVYDSVLTPAELGQVTGYLQTKYSILDLGVDPPPLGSIVDAPDFSDLSMWALNGNASQSGNRLRLTSSGNSQRGSAFVDGRVLLNDDYSFHAMFSFAISNGTGDGADGLALVLQDDPRGATALGNDGGAIGYTGIINSVGIIVKDYQSSDIQIRQSNGAVLASTNIGGANDLEDGVPRYVWVDYDGTTQLMDIFFSDSPFNPGGAPTLSAAINLPSLLGGRQDIFVGFTGATGGLNATHEVLSFRFVGVPEPTTLLLLGAGLATVARRRRRA